MTDLLLAGGMALLVSMLGTPLLINWLRAQGIGQQIREDGPQRHLTKAGTPTMGGVAIIGAAVVGYLFEHIEGTFTTRGLVAMLAVCASAGLGMMDDWIKVHRQRSLGLNKRAKAAGQFIIAVTFAVICVTWLKVDTHLSFTRYNSFGIDLGRVGWVIFAVIVIVGFSNAVNLTDGLDGLAAGSSIFSLAAFTVIGFYQLRHFAIYRNPAPLDEAALAAALIGGCAGFLWFNAPPARIFMGDTGSLGIGTAIATLALLENVDLLLLVIGGLFVVETLSVIIQVASFRLLHRRVFRMAPIHHHFELVGWPETTVIIRFWILAGLCTALALGSFYADFLSKGGTGWVRPENGPRVAIMGFGVTGRAVARALIESGDEPFVFDDSPPPGSRAVAAALGVALEPTPAAALASRLADFDLLVPSPGVPFNHPVYAAAAEAGVPVRAEIELAAELARRRGGPRLAAVTGTNGKTTVATLVTAMLHASGLTAVAAGNIGTPMIEAVTSGVEFVVAEVSSFQLQFTESFRPEVSSWLNLAPDHLDWHPTFAHYADAKARIWAHQQAGDTAVYNADDPFVATASGRVPAGVRRVSFAVSEPACFGVEGGALVGPGGEPLIEIAQLPRALPHDLSNAVAAAAVALSCGATSAGCRHALASTAVLPHRVGLVATHDDVRWFDDSKATTPASVLAAVAGFGSVVLIAGGRNKGLDLRPLASAIPPVHAVVAIGEAAPELEAVFDGLVPVVTAATMESAVEAAASMARPGDAVLLSPGCASFDWYPSYAARGEHFASIVTDRMAREEHRC